MRETIRKYNKPMRLMHWLLAIIIISLVIVGFIMGDLPNQYKGDVYGLHKSFGITVFFLAVLRLVIRRHSKIPPAPRAMTKPEQCAAKSVHYLFYIMLFLMPASGYVMSTSGGHGAKWFGIETFALVPKDKDLSKLAHDIHEVSGLVLAVLIGLHLLGTIKHHLIDKIPILKRMT